MVNQAKCESTNKHFHKKTVKLIRWKQTVQGSSACIGNPSELQTFLFSPGKFCSSWDCHSLSNFLFSLCRKFSQFCWYYLIHCCFWLHWESWSAPRTTQDHYFLVICGAFVFAGQPHNLFWNTNSQLSQSQVFFVRTFFYILWGSLWFMEHLTACLLQKRPNFFLV